MSPVHGGREALNNGMIVARIGSEKQHAPVDVSRVKAFNAVPH